MKKQILVIFTALMSLFLMTGCLGERGNSLTSSGYIVTIVEDYGTIKLFQLDGSLTTYYFSNEISAASNLGVGSRVFLNSFTIDYDNQPAGANGTKTAPMEMIAVSYEKLQLKYSVEKSSFTDAIVTDTLPNFYPPYVAATKDFGDYLNFSGYIHDGVDPIFTLVFNGVNSDTVYYDLKVTYGKKPANNKYAVFVESFRVSELGSRNILKVNFRSKAYPYNPSVFVNDSTCVFEFKRATTTTPTTF